MEKALAARIAILSAIAVVVLASGPAAAQESAAASSLRLEKEFAATLAQALPLARELRASLSAGPTPTTATTARLLAVFEEIRASHLLLAEEHDRLGKVLRDNRLAAAAANRQDQMRARYAPRLEAVVRAMDRVAAAAGQPALGADAATAVDALIRELEQAVTAPDRQPLGVTLPLRPLNLAQIEPQLGAAIVPAYADKAVPAPTPADSAASADAPLSPAILQQAAALQQNPIAIFEFVRNQCVTEFYHGAMKGAEGTLRERGGNDIDQASLLVALMRASGIPARYVRGVIALNGPQAMSWIGVASTRRAAALLSAAGIPFRPVREGGTIGAFDVEHTWVEVYVPYGNYRGVPLDSSGRTWIPLDPSFKTLTLTTGAEVPAGAHFEADALIPAYLAKPQTLSAVDFFTRTLADWLIGAGSALTLEQLTMTRAVEPATAGLLPSTLPYAPVSIHSEPPAVPEELRHRVRFVAAVDGNPSFDVTLPASELLGRRLTLSYIPATVEDQIIANAFLSLDETPAYLVHVRPVLKVGGAVRAAGEQPIPMGALHDFTIDLQTPRATVKVLNAVVAGGFFAIGLAAGGAGAAAIEPASADDTEGAGGASELHRLAIEYLDGWNKADSVLEGILHVATVRPTLSEVMVGGFYRRTLLFGETRAVEWRGLFVDADIRMSDPVAVGAADRRQDFLRLSGVAGSALEGDVLQQNLGVESISAVRLVQLARAAGIPIHDVDATNVASIVPLLGTAEAVKADVADAVNQGWRVTIPNNDSAHGIWNGIGYIVTDPAGGGGGYFISGGLAGGATIQDPRTWARHELADWFEHPYNRATDTNTNAYAAASIQKVPFTDKQEGKVGEHPAQKLAVWVRDVEGKAVQNASVTFKVLAGGGKFEGHDTATVTTDFLGLARSALTLGTKTGDSPFFVKQRPDDAHLTQVGNNLVTATVTATGGSIALSLPFQLFARPDAPHHIVKVIGDGNRAPVGTAAGTLRARVVDQYENPISNVPIDFTVGPAVPVVVNAGPLPVSAQPLRIYLQDPPCPNPHPILGECNGAAQLTVATSSVGASVETILGNTIGTEFSVQAGSKGLPSQVFSLFSDGARAFTGEFAASTLTMSLLQLVNEQGVLVNGTKVGTTFRRPLSVVLLVTEDDEPGVEPIEGPCPADPDVPCFRVKSPGTTRVRAIEVGETAVVSFTPVRGGGATVPPLRSTPDGDAAKGLYSTRLTVGLEPALNQVDVSADARIHVPTIDLHSGEEARTLVPIKAGQVITGQVSTRPPTPTATGAALPLVHGVFGVRARFPETENVFIGSAGGTTRDTTLDYVIEPAQYRPDRVDVDLFRRTPSAAPAAQDERVTLFPGRKNPETDNGAGRATVHQGTAFEPTLDYRVQVVLNRGSEAEITSEKSELGAYLVAPLGVDFRARAFTESESRGRAEISIVGQLLAEKARIAGFISSGLDQAAGDCALPIATMGLSMIEQGSGACFWSPSFQTDPVAACAAFQPGISDHDYEVFVPDAFLAQSSCLTGVLNKAAAADTLARTASGARISGDVTFFAVPKSEFQNALLNIRPPQGGGSDTLGDLGLGRQTLLLKWLLEGEYVTVFPLAQPGHLDTLTLEAILAKLHTTPAFSGEKTGIPKLEAHEIGVRERFNFYKARAHFRMAGTAAVDAKSMLFDQQQSGLRGAGKAAIRAALGRLLVSEQGQELLFITREKYRGNGCQTATDDPSQPRAPAQLGVKACDSFEEHIASAAVRSVNENLDLFTSGEVRGQVYNFFRIKAVPSCAAANCRTRIMTPTAANEFIQLAILFIKGVEERTRDLFEQGVNQDPRGAQRVANVEAAATKASAARQSAELMLEPRVVNDANLRFEFVPLDLFRNAGSEVSYELTTIEPRSERIVDIYRDLQGNPIRDENNKPQPIFKRPIAADVTIPFTFVLDRGNKIRECVKQDNSAGFFVYTLDESNPDPPPLPGAPPVPQLFPAPPDACLQNALPTVTLTKLVNGQPDIVVAPHTPVTVTNVVTNTGPSHVVGIVLQDLLLGRSFGPFALGPGASRTIEEPFVPQHGGVRLIGATELVGFTTDDRVVRTWDSAIVDVTRAMCSAVVVPTDPDPNPYVGKNVPVPGLAVGAAFSQVMVGGSLFRHYRVHEAGGHPFRFARISMSVNGHPFEAQTDGDGYFIHDVDGKPQRGLQVQAEWLGAATEPATPLLVQFLGVNGISSVCAKPFWVALVPREFTQTLKGGTSIKLEGAIATLSLNGKTGYGVEMAIENKTGPKLFRFGRSSDVAVGASIKGVAAKGRVKVFGEASLGSAEVSAGVSAALSISDEHKFEMPLDGARKLAIGELLLATWAMSASTSIPGGPVFALILNEVFERLTSLDDYRSGVGTSVGLTVSGGVKVNGPTVSLANTGIPGLEDAALGVGVAAGASAGITAGFKLAPLDKTFSTSVDYRAEGNIKAGLKLGAAQLTPFLDDNEELDFLTKAVDTLDVELNGSIAGNITFKTTFDTSAVPLDLKRVDISVSTKKGLGFKVPFTDEATEDIKALGSTNTTKLSVTDPAKIQEAVERITMIQALAAVPVANIFLGPDFLGSQIAELMTLYDGYEKTVEKGNGIELAIGAGAFAEGTGLDAELALKLDNTVNYAVEKGAVRKAGRFKLESYPDDDATIPSPAAASVPLALLNDVFGDVKQKVSTAFTHLAASILPSLLNPLSLIDLRFSPSGVDLVIQNSAESAPFTVDLVAYKYRPLLGPVASAVQDPSDPTGPADKPHYGIGGFFNFAPLSKRLAAPARLTIYYLDDEVASFDERTLAIYVWNDTRNDWDRLGGTVDLVGNSVTTTITALGLYTVAPPMPRGTIAFTPTVTLTTSGPEPTTTVTFTSGPLSLNIGAPVADGTMFSVSSLVPFASVMTPLGTIVTADADPLTDGVQVRSQGGRIQFTAEYAAAAGEVRAVAFSAVGTAFGEQVVRFPE